mgnify:CR=1 FL=1|tara:strand:+ start:134 stop:565 length:432 start_codon:yes stop_codon:yes gene_type:complete
MILERVEKDGLVKAIYESSNIVASTYDKNKKDLNIIFKYGGSYTYQGVPDTDYLRFETAESQGVVLNKNLKKYPHLKHDNVDVSKFLEEITKSNDSEIFAMEDGIIKSMKIMTSDFDNEGVFSINLLDRVSNMVNLYNEIKNK